jgi:hypothetical protein
VAPYIIIFNLSFIIIWTIAAGNYGGEVRFARDAFVLSSVLVAVALLSWIASSLATIAKKFNKA